LNRTSRGTAAPAALLGTLLAAVPSAAAPEAPAPEVAEDPWDEAVLMALADDVVRVASYYAQDERQAPGLVTVVTRREVLGLGARTVADVLRTLPGVDLVLSNDGRLRPAFRGLDQRADVLLLLDGQRVNDPLTGAAVDELPASVLERIEVIRGPGSALYGSNAFLGVVSLTTRDAGPLQTAVRYGSFATVGLSASVGDGSGPWRYGLVADVARSDGLDLVLRSDRLLDTDPEVTRVPHAVDGSWGRLTTRLTAGRGPVDVGVALYGETRGPYVGPTNILALGSELTDHFASAWARLEVEVLALDGHTPVEQTVRIRRGEAAAVRLRLQRTARLDVLSEPPGATVTLDGRAAGETPVSLPSLDAGGGGRGWSGRDLVEGRDDDRGRGLAAGGRPAVARGSGRRRGRRLRGARGPDGPGAAGVRAGGAGLPRRREGAHGRG